MGNEPGDGRPLIGLTVEVLEPPLYEGRRRYQLFTDYLEGCLREAGGVGILIPGDTPPDDLGPILEALDGILLTGGDDLDLRALGGPAPLETSKPVPPLQQALNLALVEEAGRRKMPTLGVCLGMQVMGVGAGAPFIQHLEDADRHRAGVEHEVRPVSGTLLASLLGEEPFSVPSFHHQALEAPGETLRASAWSEDGILEGVEDPEHPFSVGVQWHPERAPDSAATRALFSGFVEAARAYGGRE